MGYSFLGKYHGVLVIPEGLIESIPEMYALIQVHVNSYLRLNDKIYNACSVPSDFTHFHSKYISGNQ